MMIKAMAMTSFLLFCKGKLLPLVASTHAAMWPHKPSRQKEEAPVPRLWLFFMIFQVIIMHCKPKEQQEKVRGSKAAGNPREPRKAVAVRVPVPSGTGSGAAPGLLEVLAVRQEDPHSGAGLPFPVASLWIYFWDCSFAIGQ